MVDDEDYDYLMQWKWYAQKSKHTYYPTRGVFNDKKRNNDKIRMHNMIINPPKGMIIDHRDHNPLNNQKSNLRLATIKDNARNKSSQLQSSSKFLGVSLYTAKYTSPITGIIKIYPSKWKSQIKSNGISYLLGYFDSEEMAAKAYDHKAKELYGEFASLNFK